MSSITIHPELITELSLWSTQPQALITHNPRPHSQPHPHPAASRMLVGILLTSFLINVFFGISLDLQENSTRQPREHLPGPPSSCIADALCNPSTLITIEPPTLLTEFRLVQFLQFSHSSPFLGPESNPRSHTALSHLVFLFFSALGQCLHSFLWPWQTLLERHYSEILQNVSLAVWFWKPMFA